MGRRIFICIMCATAGVSACEVERGCRQCDHLFWFHVGADVIFIFIIPFQPIAFIIVNIFAIVSIFCILFAQCGTTGARR